MSYGVWRVIPGPEVVGSEGQLCTPRWIPAPPGWQPEPTARIRDLHVQDCCPLLDGDGTAAGQCRVPQGPRVTIT